MSMVEKSNCGKTEQSDIRVRPKLIISAENLIALILDDFTTLKI
jgi:hypothetical protein